MLLRTEGFVGPESGGQKQRLRAKSFVQPPHMVSLRHGCSAQTRTILLVGTLRRGTFGSETTSLSDTDESLKYPLPRQAKRRIDGAGRIRRNAQRMHQHQQQTHAQKQNDMAGHTDVLHRARLSRNRPLAFWICLSSPALLVST